MQQKHNIERFSFLEASDFFSEKNLIENAICYTFIQPSGSATIYIPFTHEDEFAWYYQGKDQDDRYNTTITSGWEDKGNLPEWILKLVEQAENELFNRDKIRKIFMEKKA